jgi:hypothetical protein
VAAGQRGHDHGADVLLCVFTFGHF